MCKHLHAWADGLCPLRRRMCTDTSTSKHSLRLTLHAHGAVCGRRPFLYISILVSHACRVCEGKEGEEGVWTTAGV